MSIDDEKYSPVPTFGEAFATAAAEAAPVEPRVHVGVGAVVEKKDGGRRGTMVVPNLAASRRCAATIPENLNDIWWVDAKMDKPVDGHGVLFFTGTEYCCGCRKQNDGHFWWTDQDKTWSDEQVTHWMPLPSVPK